MLGQLRRQAAAGRSFVLVTGMSGCGKSSLVRAGVLPLLTTPGVVVASTLAVDRLPSERTGRRPGRRNPALDLFDVLAAALVRKEALPELLAAGTTPATLAAMLKTSPNTIGEPVKAGLALAAEAYRRENLDRPPESRLALVVDQLEEIFTLTQVTSEDRKRFIDALAVLARGGQAYVMATLRADFLPRCAELPELITLRAGDGLFELMPPSADEIGQMIRKPAAVAGLRFEQVEGRGPLDDVLRDEAITSPENLPLLEYALDELYEQRSGDLLTFAAYDELGGILGALPRRAEETFGHLSSGAKAAAGRGPRTGQGRRRGRREAHSPFRRGPRWNSRRPSPSSSMSSSRPASSSPTSRPTDCPSYASHTKCWSPVGAASRDWYARNRAALRSRDRVESEALRWKDKEPSDLLLPDGTRLREGEDVLSAGFPDLDPSVDKFVKASRRKAEHGRHLWQIVTAVFVILFLASGVAAYFAYAQWTRADHAEAAATVRASRPSR